MSNLGYAAFCCETSAYKLQASALGSLIELHGTARLIWPNASKSFEFQFYNIILQIAHGLVMSGTCSLAFRNLAYRMLHVPTVCLHLDM